MVGNGRIREEEGVGLSSAPAQGNSPREGRGGEEHIADPGRRRSRAVSVSKRGKKSTQKSRRSEGYGVWMYAGLGMVIFFLLFTNVGRSTTGSVVGAVVTPVQTVVSLLRQTKEDRPDSLHSLVLNCTGELEGLIILLEEFLQQPDIDATGVEERLKDFLLVSAAKRYRKLEYGLDWVIGLYRIALPFVILQLVMRVMGGGEERRSEHRKEAAQMGRRRRSIERNGSSGSIISSKD